MKTIANVVVWPDSVKTDYETNYQVGVNPYSNSRTFIIGIFFGLILSAVIVLLVYKLDDTVKTKEELERLTGALFLSYVEDIKDEKGGARKWVF